jgi:hypothetical protein
MQKLVRILLNALPVLAMIALIPLVADDYILTFIFVVIIALSFLVRYERQDTLALVLGVLVMTLGEYIFISTGVETFERISFLGVMPLWLPVLWGYCFVAIKRTARILR